MHTRLQEQYGITVDAADRLCRVESEHSFAPAVKFFEAATADGYHRPTSNWCASNRLFFRPSKKLFRIAHDIMGLLTKHELAFDDLPITPEDLRVLISAINEKKITSKIACTSGLHLAEITLLSSHPGQSAAVSIVREWTEAARTGITTCNRSSAIE